jgi:hypothetical protein
MQATARPQLVDLHLLKHTTVTNASARRRHAATVINQPFNVVPRTSTSATSSSIETMLRHEKMNVSHAFVVQRRTRRRCTFRCCPRRPNAVTRCRNIEAPRRRHVTAANIASRHTVTTRTTISCRREKRKRYVDIRYVCCSTCRHSR